MPDSMHGNHEDDNDDEPLALNPSTLEALAHFYTERDTRLKQFEDLKAQAEEDADASEELDIDTLFAEDWNASQFWYTKETATILANELLSDCTDETCIAVVSAPSVFIQLKNILRSTPTAAKPQINLFEYDKRFNVFREFVTYDFEHPLRLPGELKGRFDRIICDPPFLSEDCQTKTALTVRWLSKASSKNSVTAESGLPSTETTDLGLVPNRLIVCSGERMESLINRLYNKAKVHTTSFEPQHSKGLGNEFRCYANFDGAAWT